MRHAAWVLVGCVVACNEPYADDDGHGGSGNGSGSGSGSADLVGCDREVAPGYPKVGVGCKAHASVKLDANTYELTGDTGIGAIGSTLQGFAVADRTESITFALPTLAPGTYTSSIDCMTIDMPGLFTSHDGHATVALHANADAVWGEVDASVCRLDSVIIIDGQEYKHWGCISVLGKFAALRDQSVACPTCKPTVYERDNLCELPYCTEQGCWQAYCYLQQPTCNTIAPPFDGTYRGDLDGGTVMQMVFDHGTPTRIQLDGLVTGDTHEPVGFVTTEFPPGTVTRSGTQYHIVVPAVSSIDLGFGSHFDLTFDAAARLVVDGRIAWDIGGDIALAGRLDHQ